MSLLPASDVDAGPATAGQGRRPCRALAAARPARRLRGALRRGALRRRRQGAAGHDRQRREHRRPPAGRGGRPPPGRAGRAGQRPDRGLRRRHARHRRGRRGGTRGRLRGVRRRGRWRGELGPRPALELLHRRRRPRGRGDRRRGRPRGARHPPRRRATAARRARGRWPSRAPASPTTEPRTGRSLDPTATGDALAAAWLAGTTAELDLVEDAARDRRGRPRGGPPVLRQRRGLRTGHAVLRAVQRPPPARRLHPGAQHGAGRRCARAPARRQGAGRRCSRARWPSTVLPSTRPSRWSAAVRRSCPPSPA